MNYDELLEFQRFRDFLPTKNAINVFYLTGNDNIGDNMKIVIDASPERMTTIVFYDGIGNQIYPPAPIDNDKILDFIKGMSDEHDIVEIVIAGPRHYTEKIEEVLKSNFKTVNFTMV